MHIQKHGFLIAWNILLYNLGLGAHCFTVLVSAF